MKKVLDWKRNGDKWLVNGLLDASVTLRSSHIKVPSILFHYSHPNRMYGSTSQSMF